jgi:glycerol-3-phosphate dehydrogenase (NAD(P)+)
MAENENGPIAIVGGGAWGTALSIHVARNGDAVRLWLREAELVTRMRERHDNPVYLPGVVVPRSVRPFESLGPTLEAAGVVVVAVPSQFARTIYREMSPKLPAGVPVVVACKGIEEETLDLPLEVARDELGRDAQLAVLSGPTFAAEVAEGHPTAVVVASEDEALASQVQERLSSSLLRLYTNTDAVGVQVAGALKNVIAIAVGIGDSLGMGTNARAALITRGLAEITRLGLSLGGRPSTFSGLAGLGDLVLTCTGELSRNRGVGRRIGHGERLQDILAVSRSVAEGVRTTLSARRLARRAGLDLPIVEEVHRILYEDGSPHEALERLMNRPLTSEHESDA